MINKNFILGYGAGVAAGGGGGGGGDRPTAKKKAVNFYDYDGHILYSYTNAQASILTELPAGPTHEGLTFHGWNWTLETLKAQVEAVGSCDVGAIYDTTDGKTHIFISLLEGRLSPTLRIAVNGECPISWGDGQTETVTGESTSTEILVPHAYSSPGEYEIKLGGDYYFKSDRLFTGMPNENPNYNSTITKLYLAKRPGQHAFESAYSLEAVSINSGVPDISAYAFSYCRSLRHINIPAGCSAVNSFTYSSIGSISLSIPTSFTDYFNGAFSNCMSLREISLPKGMKSVYQSTFNYCSSLIGITIPDTVTNIGIQALANCNSLGYIKFKSNTPPTVGSATALSPLPTDCKIYVPASADHSVLNAYKAANNYPNPTVYEYIEY